MEPITSLLLPVAKGFAGVVGGSALLGGGGYIVYKKYTLRHPLLEILSAVSEKKFSRSSLVSCSIRGNGVAEYRLKIPSGYSVQDLLKLKPAIEDKLDCEIQVWAEEKNFLIEVQLNPIPKKLVFDKKKVVEILKDYECAMYLGESRKGSMVIDFTENLTPHLLFGAPTGGGKSNLLNQGICGMMEAYTPEELNLVLIDLKDGVEFSPYETMKHVIGFYETFSQAEAGLQNILLELKRRNGVFKKAGVKKLSEYNKENPPLPRIVIIADEFAQFNNIGDKELKKSIYGKWEEILQKGRSTGIHVVVGTQVADADVFPKQVKGNIDARFGFKFTDIQHSKMISGGSELTYLPNIIGRGMFKLGSTMIQTQVPKLETGDFEEILTTHRREELEDVIDLIEETMDTVEDTPIFETPDNSIENLFVDEETFRQQNQSVSLYKGEG